MLKGAQSNLLIFFQTFSEIQGPGIRRKLITCGEFNFFAAEKCTILKMLMKTLQVMTNHDLAEV